MSRRPEWTPDQLLILRDNFGSKDDAWLRYFIGLEVPEINRKARELVLRKNKSVYHGLPMPRWTDRQVEILRELYPVNSNQAIAIRLKRSVKSVLYKAHQLRLKKDPERLEVMGRQNRALRRPVPGR